MPPPLDLQRSHDAREALAHDIRNRLGAILNAVALLRRGAPDLRAEELYAIIEEEAGSIDALLAGRQPGRR